MSVTSSSAIRVGFWAKPVRFGDGLAAALISFAGQVALQLPRVEDYVDASWSGRERNAVLRYVRNPIFKSVAYMGESDCRICGQCNGFRDYTDGAYIWPEGFGHYIEEHRVKPPRSFIDHVMGHLLRTQG